MVKGTSILKWVGGKSEILEELFEKFPTEIDNYYEPFCGGGSVFIHLLEKIEDGDINVRGKMYINDVNPHLINMYKVIRSNHNDLMNRLEFYNKMYVAAQMEEYSSRFNFENLLNGKERIEECLSGGKQLVYYFCKNEFNRLIMSEEYKNGGYDENLGMIIEVVALFIFLNKTGFRGLYRENSRGLYNVPFGNYAKPEIVNRKMINKLNNLFINVVEIEFSCSDFDNFLGGISDNEMNFVYMDPPYYPIKNDSFVSYQGKGFDEECHLNLTRMMRNMSERGIKVMMSNHRCEFIERELEGFNMEVIEVKRRINSKNPDSKTDEYIIWN